MKCKILLSLIFYLMPIGASAKCIGFDNGSPNFCSRIRIVNQLNQEKGKCLLSAKILALKPAFPKYYDFVEFENIAIRRNEVVVQIATEECSFFKDHQEYNGVLVAKCNDNLSYWEVFRDWIGVPIVKAQFDFGKMMDVFYFKEGTVKTVCSP